MRVESGAISFTALLGNLLVDHLHFRKHLLNQVQVELNLPICATLYKLGKIHESNVRLSTNHGYGASHLYYSYGKLPQLYIL